MNIKKILIYGIGSIKNRGCEALLNSTIDQIDKNVEIIAATFDYEINKNMYKNRISKVINHYKNDLTKFTDKEKNIYNKITSMPYDYNNYEDFYQRDVIKELKNVDIAIHIGGDNYCYPRKEWMYSINKNAKKYNKKTVLWGASLYDEINDLELIEDLKKYDLLMIREKISYNAIKQIIPEERLLLTPDPAFSLKPKEILLNKWYKDKKIVGINLSPLTIKNKENYEDTLKLIKYILKKTNYSILLLPHVTVEEVDDLKILRKIAENFKDNKRVYLEEKDYNCQELKYIISKCEIFIAARTHASIAAYSSCIPTLVIGYSVKSRGIAEDLFGNYKDYVIPTEELTSDILIEKFKFLDKNQNAIKQTLENKMPSLYKESKNMYKRMLQKLEKLEKQTICQKEKCIGCGVCATICPKEAIKMEINEEGFFYPKIDLKKCINCGLCREKCCINNKKINQKNYKDKSCFAVTSENNKIVKQSSSSGVFYFLAKHFIENNGIVYGAHLNNFKVRHIKVDRIENIKKIQGSKYTQSNLNSCFQEIEKFLKDNKKVLFSGTPCQILALKNYLLKDYKNLYTISVICHGVINNKILEKRIKEIEKTFETKMKNINFRSKINGWDIASIEYETERLKKVYKFSEDPMMNLYVNNYILRENCYNCPAKGKNNCADIILGDFWGIYNIYPDMFNHHGVSAVILNTKKGQNLFNSIKQNFIIRNIELENIVKYNSLYEFSADKPLIRNTIFNYLNDNTFTLIDKTFNTKELEKAKEKIIILTERNNQKSFELENIVNSKRYKLINKIGNIKNKIFIRRRKNDKKNI